jgi:hypothetical protein
MATTLRQLGHAVLCGVLHIAYEGSGKVKGHYAICIIYRSWIVLATTASNCGTYLVDAIIPLANVTVHAADDGRGMQ